jgi:hypothetical protein
MIEIIVLIFLSRKMAAIVRDKGRSPVGYVLMLILFWLGAEFAAGIIGGIVSFALNLQEEVALLAILPFALIGAACGAGLAFLIAYSVPALHDDRIYDDDFDIHGYPRKRGQRALPKEEPYWNRQDHDRYQAE